MARGVYKTRTAESGAEYAYVDYGVASNAGEIPKARYEAKGYQPPFDKLPTKEQYEASRRGNAPDNNDGKGQPNWSPSSTGTMPQCWRPANAR